MTPAQVQEMIDAALDFTTGVINLSNATADQVKSAFSDPDRWLCSIDWSGDTYLEQYRSVGNSGTSYTLYFYVMGAQPTQQRKKIMDVIIRARVTPSTGAVEIDTTPYDYVPNTIYDFDQMNSAQTAVVFTRVGGHSLMSNIKRFSAVWTYNGRNYVYSTGNGINTPNLYLLGSTLKNVNGVITIYYDSLQIGSDGTLTHHEYSSNIQLTSIQE